MTTTSNGNSGSDAKKETGEASFVVVDEAIASCYFRAAVRITKKAWATLVDHNEPDAETRSMNLSDLLYRALIAGRTIGTKDSLSFVVFNGTDDFDVRLRVTGNIVDRPQITLLLGSEDA